MEIVLPTACIALATLITMIISLLHGIVVIEIALVAEVNCEILMASLTRLTFFLD